MVSAHETGRATVVGLQVSLRNLTIAALVTLGFILPPRQLLHEQNNKRHQ